MDDVLPDLSRTTPAPPPKKVVRWVEGYVRRETRVSAVGAGALLLVGSVALVFTFGFWYAIVTFLCSGLIDLSTPLRLLITGAIVALLFVAERTSNYDDLQRLEIETTPGSRLVIDIARATGYGYLSPVLSLEHARAGVKVAAVLFLIAPHTLSHAVRLWRRATRVSKLDVQACARVLTALLTADGKVSFNELARTVPGIRWEELLPLMRDMLGVVFLFAPPEGMTVADHLRDEIVGRKT